MHPQRKMAGRTAASVLTTALCMMAFVHPQTALAGGFQINEQSARGTALGGALAASVHDPTAMRVNPAILSFLHGTNLSLGTTVMVPDYRFTGVTPSQSTTKMRPQALFPPNVYLTYSPGGSIAFGISALVPFALKTEWNPDWVGRRISIKAEMQTVFLTPTIAFQPSANMSIGIGINLVSSKLLLSQRIGFEPLTDPEGTATYEGDTRFDYGFGVGLLYRLNDAVSLGLAYQSKVDVNVRSGNATFQDVPASVASSFPASEASTSLTTPDNIHLGLRIHPAEMLTILGEFQYVLWSSFNSLPISFTDPRLKSIVLLENWRDSYVARFGVELAFAGVALRAGILYDQSPIPNSYIRPTIPDADKVGYSAGLGYTIGENLSLDIALLHSRLSERSVTDSKIEYLPGQYFNGSYSGSSTVFAVNISYTWNQ